jgi:hypothetical protein
MRIIDCQGSPALLVRGDGSYRALNNDERNAWRAGGVEAFLVTKAQRDIIVAHYFPTQVVLDKTDTDAIVSAVVAALPAGWSLVTASEVEAAVRRVFADAGQEG